MLAFLEILLQLIASDPTGATNLDCIDLSSIDELVDEGSREREKGCRFLNGVSEPLYWWPAGWVTHVWRSLPGRFKRTSRLVSLIDFIGCTSVRFPCMFLSSTTRCSVVV